MDSIDLEVLSSCKRWLAGGHRCELVTVIKTWGYSPRPEVAMLAICDDGRVVGSVSGGCIEDDLIDRVRKQGMTRDLPEIAISILADMTAAKNGVALPAEIQVGNAKSAKTPEPADQDSTSCR